MSATHPGKPQSPPASLVPVSQPRRFPGDPGVSSGHGEGTGCLGFFLSKIQRFFLRFASSCHDVLAPGGALLLCSQTAWWNDYQRGLGAQGRSTLLWRALPASNLQGSRGEEAADLFFLLGRALLLRADAALTLRDTNHQELSSGARDLQMQTLQGCC